MDKNSLAHTQWNCKYHVVFAPKYRRQVIYGNRHFWCQGYYVDTVGRNEKAIREYVKNQLQEDIANDQISIQEYIDPFTGKQVEEGKKK
ncbi:transposase [Fusibacter sp. 3D3]|uniref:transposase n=1 Tax=Fusibacter sp. 3D3 TaxID=1048380 RepID=UPI000852CDEE|nr:transposase [Fusibacter sp. 3D3]GAU76039.1 mobile element protein [Fusibacter sp. 3D3]